MFVKAVGNLIRRTSVERAKHLPAANTAAVVTLSAVAGKDYVIHGVQRSYDGTPTGGSLIVSIAAVNEWKVAITAGGPGSFSAITLPAGTNEAVVLTLAAGGAGVTGTLMVQYSLESTSTK